MSATASDLLEVFSSYDGSVLFRGLTQSVGGMPPVLGRIGWVFTALGAFFTLWGFVLRAQRMPSGSKLDEVARTWLVVALILAGPLAMRSAMQASDSLYAQTIGGPGALTAACVKAAYAMPELEKLFDVLQAASPGGPPAPSAAEHVLDQANDGTVVGYIEAFGAGLWDVGATYASDAARTWNGALRMAALASGLGAALLKCLLILATVGPVYLLLLLSAALIWSMQQLRYFLAVTGTMILPLFTGMLSLPEGHPNRQAAHAYMMRMVSLALWPVAWAIGHTGTIALYDALIALISGTSRVPDFAAALGWSAVSTQPPSAAQLAAMEGALGNWMMGNLAGLLSLLVGALGFAAWVACVSLLGPVFLHGMLVQGSHFFAQAAASSGRAAVGAARTAALAAPLAGGAPAALLGGAAAGERLASALAAQASPVLWGRGGAAPATMGDAARAVDNKGGA